MKKLNFAIVFILSLAVVSCTPGGGNSNPDDLAGFFTGIWHGWIAPFSLILGFFNPEIRVYEIYNTGWWYDFGFLHGYHQWFWRLVFF